MPPRVPAGAAPEPALPQELPEQVPQELPEQVPPELLPGAAR